MAQMISDRIVRIANNMSETSELSSFMKNLDKKKRENAAREHSVTQDSILFLYDLTYLGSATESVILTDSYLSIIVKEQQKAIQFPWGGIEIILPSDIGLIVISNGWNYIFKTIKIPKEAHSFFGSISETCENSFEKDKKALILKFSELDRGDELSVAEFIQSCESLLARPHENGINTELLKVHKAESIEYFRHDLNLCYVEALSWHGKSEYARKKLDEALTFAFSSYEEVDYLFQYSELCCRIREYNRAYLFSIKRKSLGTDNNNRKMQETKDRILQCRISDLDSERKSRPEIILCSNEEPNSISNEFFWATKRQLENSQLSFPLGFPEDGCLYAKHPYRESVYYPIDSIHDELFREKHREALDLLKHLGATTLIIETLQKSNCDESQATKYDIEVGIKAKGVGLSGGFEDATEKKQAEGMSVINRQKLSFVPVENPNIPDNLIWFSHEPTWQHWAQYAMSNSCLEIEMDVEYKSDFSYNESRMRKIAGSLKDCGYGFSAEFEKKTSEKFSSRKIQSMSIHATFDGAIERNYRQRFEIEYIEDLADCMEDGILSKDEIRILERRRIKLGIDKDRARELARKILEQRK